jgi:2-hydroxy-3-oxopropionate reductase
VANTVCVIGLGVMGAPIAAHLARRGFALRVFNRSAGKAEPLRALGAKVALSARAAADGAEVAILSLPATADVEAVLFGADGIAPVLAPGSAVIDTSTIDPIAARDFAARLAPLGVDLLDAPVSGGEKGAVDGTLTCMVGGSDTALARATPYLAAFSARILHIGPSGAGQIAKACNQVCAAAAMLGVAEAMALAVRLGIEPARVRDAIQGGTGNSVMLERNALRVVARDFRPGFRASLMQKDLGIALAAMAQAGVPAEGTALVRRLLTALMQDGRGDADWCAIAGLIQERAGIDDKTAASS